MPIANPCAAAFETQGVRVSLIIPGFVKTPLNDSIDAMKPLEITGTGAATLIKMRP